MQNLNAKPDISSTRRVVIDRTAVVYGQTPLAIRKKQLKSMAAEQDLDLNSFCCHILSLSEVDQFKMLHHYYENINETLGKFFKEFDCHNPESEWMTEKLDHTPPLKHLRKDRLNLESENRQKVLFKKNSVKTKIDSSNCLREVETKGTSSDFGSKGEDFVSTGKNSVSSVLVSSKDKDRYQSVITRQKVLFKKNSVKTKINSSNCLREVETKGTSSDFGSTGKNSVSSVLVSSKDKDRYQSVITRQKVLFKKNSVKTKIDSSNCLREVETKGTSSDFGSKGEDLVSTGKNSVSSVLVSSKDKDRYQSVITTLLFNAEDSELKKRMTDLSKRRKLSPTKCNSILESLLFE